MTTTDLIAMLEDAQEGSRILDANIALSLVAGKTDYVSKENASWFRILTMSTPEEVRGANPDPKRLPLYTTSIDAALTLVPDALIKAPNWWGIQRGGLTYFHAWAGNMNRYVEDGAFAEPFSQASTPALALCAAALKAREE